jgi:GNAT superfamily N-acetyltransferase
MRERPALFLGLLADQPELIAEVGTLRWRSAGESGTPGRWIEWTALHARGDGLPLTLVAMDLDGHAIGAVTLAVSDESVAGSCDGRTPWLLDMVVRQGERRCGVGRLMVTALTDLATQLGHEHIWVAASDEDAGFYLHCGWLETRPQPRLPAERTLMSKELDIVLP